MLITDVIADLITVVNPLYHSDNVFVAYQNSYTLPIHDDFIVITPLGIEVEFTPIYKYYIEPEQQSFYNVSYCGFQIDYYGKMGLQAVNDMQLVLLSDFGCQHFQDNDLGIYKVDVVRNMSNIIDRDVYVARYVLEFSLFARQEFKITTTNFGIEILNNVNLFYTGEMNNVNRDRTTNIS